MQNDAQVVKTKKEMKSVDVEGEKVSYRRARRIASVLKDRSESRWCGVGGWCEICREKADVEWPLALRPELYL